MYTHSLTLTLTLTLTHSLTHSLMRTHTHRFRSSNLVYARSRTDMTIKGHLEAELVQLYAGGEINLMEKAKLAPTMTIGTVRAGGWVVVAMVEWG